MDKLLLISVLSTFSSSSGLMGQHKEVYSAKFESHSVTYNGSPNPNECWESVANGIIIKTEKEIGFFTMPNNVMESLKKKIGDAEVLIEVIYYEEPLEESGALGGVQKITLKGEVLFKNS